MTTLSPELQAWVSYALMTGHSDEVIAAQLTAGGLPTHDLKDWLDDLRRNPLAGVGAEFARGLSQARWLLQLQSDLRKNLKEVVPRRHQLAADHFREDFLGLNRPVLLTGLLDGWSALQTWNEAMLGQRFGPLPIEYTEAGSKGTKLDTFANFLQRIKTDMCYYTAYNQQGKDDPVARSLFAETRSPEGYCEGTGEGRIYYWIGPGGTRTGLHFDPYNVLFVQVTGTKRFVLMPPSEIPKVYLENEFFSQVDLNAPDLHRFPKYQNVAQYTVDVGPGEILFLPVGWLHQVTSLDFSVSVSLTHLVAEGGNHYAPPSSFQGVL